MILRAHYIVAACRPPEEEDGARRRAQLGPLGALDPARV